MQSKTIDQIVKELDEMIDETRRKLAKAVRDLDWQRVRRYRARVTWLCQRRTEAMTLPLFGE